MENYLNIINEKVNSLQWEDESSEARIEFLRVSANGMKIKDIEEDLFFKNYSIQKRLTINEINNFSTLYNDGKIKIYGEENLIFNGPAFYGSFHIGPYMTIPILLALKKITFSVVMDDYSFKRKVRYENPDINPKTSGIDLNLKTNPDFLNAEDTRSIFKMIKNIKENKSLFSYLDGNTTTINNQKHSLNVKCMNEEISAQKGIPYLCHLLKIPLIPIFSYREDNLIKVVIKKPIYPLEDRNAFCEESLTKCWSMFENVLKEFTEQYEFLNKNIFVPNDNILKLSELEFKEADYRYKFNSQLYNFYIKGDDYLLFNNDSLNSLKINKGVYNLLRKLHDKKISINEMELIEFIPNKKFVEALIQNQILI
ncbi:lysophospholipid acyltransferase family protein [Flavobacterium reichenbachii]|uniref:Uncharacterized protein n=1 Tax=Flavobacterium reichenbachii TaxID=362418 RepID=A0A085ZPI2_9FLAO|nr:hypothetical protein [Flavobacterium reichenbachii]KFF06346.1 hypothetical protein IW19_12825 [Flavobacterium reichenbachii]OXB17436.1 hypothetical protein B0A68_03835 [Flavobacterium reichenbachii]